MGLTKGAMSMYTSINYEVCVGRGYVHMSVCIPNTTTNGINAYVAYLHDDPNTHTITTSR